MPSHELGAGLAVWLAPWAKPGPDPLERLVFAGRKHLAANALVVAFYSSSLFSLALSRWLFVKLTCTKIGKKADFFDGALKAPHGSLKGLVFFDSDDWHKVSG
jgi:hypothetical protein